MTDSALPEVADKETTLRYLRAWHGEPCREEGHEQADEALIDFLRYLGHGDVADAWNKIGPKWYA